MVFTNHVSEVHYLARVQWLRFMILPMISALFLIIIIIIIITVVGVVVVVVVVVVVGRVAHSV